MALKLSTRMKFRLRKFSRREAKFIKQLNTGSPITGVPRKELEKLVFDRKDFYDSFFQADVQCV